MKGTKWSGGGHLCPSTVACLSPECQGGSIFLCQPRMSHGDAKAPSVLLSWNISFSPTPPCSWEVINLSTHPSFCLETRVLTWSQHHRSVNGNGLPKTSNTFPWLLHVPITGFLLSHSLRSGDLSVCPGRVPMFLQDWKPLELDKSEIPKLKICSFPLVCGFPFNSFNKH